MRRVASFVRGQVLPQRFASWKYAHRVVMRRRASDTTAVRVVRHLANRKLSAGLRGWVATWEARRELLRSMRRGLVHLVHREIACAWGSWRELVAVRNEKRQALRRGLGFMLNGRLARGFSGWRARVERRVPEGVARAVSRLLHQQLSRGLSAWVAASALVAAGGCPRVACSGGQGVR